MVNDTGAATCSYSAAPIFDGPRPETVIALIGNPNVGKSTLFNHMTGLGVVTAHYPGKTLEVNVGSTTLDGRSISIVDFPGTYSLGAEATIRLKDARGVLVRGCRPETGTKSFLKLQGMTSERVILTGNDFSGVAKIAEVGPDVAGSALKELANHTGE